MNEPSALCGTKLGNYRLERVLGRGRMGIVYLARDEALLRPTAVKLLSWQASDREGQDPEAWFLAEARSVARINHPNVVQIYGVAKQERRCYIAMEYVAGGSVEALVTKSGPMTPVRATGILIQCAEALHAAHNVGIVHRDVKPENLLVGADGVVKLGDFGMAMHLARPRANEPARAGTPNYTAPEIWEGQPASASSDLYALGATYFFMLTGRVPFEARDLQALVAAHLRGLIPSASMHVSSVPAGCDRLIRKCLAKSTKDRLASARALSLEAQALLRELDSEPETLRPGPAVEAAAKSLRISRYSELCPANPDGSADLRPEQTSTLFQWLESQDSQPMLVVGESGCGRTALLNRLAARHALTGTAIVFDGAEVRSLGRNIAALDRNTMDELSALLLETVERHPSAQAPSRRPLPQSTLLIVDADWSFERLQSFLEDLRRFAPAGSLKLALSGLQKDIPHLRELVKAGAEQPVTICEVPPLTLRQAYQFVMSRCSAILANGKDVLLTPDAALLIAYFGVGNPRRILELMSCLASVVQATGLRILTSWEIWMAQFAESADDDVPTNPGRPAEWPTARVCEILNQCRAKCGMPERRTGSEVGE